MIQNSHQRAHNAGVGVGHTSPPLHWQPYSTASLKQQGIYSEQSHMPLAVAKSCSPRKRFAKLFAGKTGPCPTKEGISFKQSGLQQPKKLMHRISILTSKALATERMDSKYKTHEVLDGNQTQTLSV